MLIEKVKAIVIYKYLSNGVIVIIVDIAGIPRKRSSCKFNSRNKDITCGEFDVGGPTLRRNKVGGPTF